MKHTWVFAAAALVSTAAWSQGSVGNVFPCNTYAFGCDNQEHILNDLARPTDGMKMGQPEYYGTSKQSMTSRKADSYDFNQDEAGNVILDVRPELIPNWNPR